MWNPFRRSNSAGPRCQSPSAEQKRNCVEELVNALQSKGCIQELERELTRLDPSSLTEAEQESWWHLFGIAAFRGGRDAEALRRFQEAYERFPRSALIRFSLGQQYIRTHSVERGFALFRTCQFPELPRDHVLAQARYAYLWNRHDDGKFFLRPFLDAYKQVKILDDHFLYIRGLPFFGSWWAYLAAFAVLTNEFDELESVTDFVVKNCHDYDFDYLQAQLKACRDDEPGQLLDASVSRLRSMPKGNFPTGYTRMHIAVIRARATTQLEDAREFLQGVALTEQDLPWLEDVRTLALAEAAHRFGDNAAEAEHAEVFLARQALLFEPDIALSFHLLRYQERLKPRVAAQ